MLELTLCVVGWDGRVGVCVGLSMDAWINGETVCIHVSALSINPPYHPVPTYTNHRNHGTEKDEAFSYDSGNVEPHRGFGHIAVACDDVYAACGKLEEVGGMDGVVMCAACRLSSFLSHIASHYIVNRTALLTDYPSSHHD